MSSLRLPRKLLSQRDQQMNQKVKTKVQVENQMEVDKIVKKEKELMLKKERAQEAMSLK